MKTSVVGLVLCVFVVLMGVVVLPMYGMAVHQHLKSETEMMSEVAEFIDEVRDTRVLTDDMIADFNLALAAKTNNYTATITRRIKVTNPDPLNPGEVRSTYMVTDNISTWEQGDIIIVEVESFGQTPFSVITSRLMGLNVGNSEFRLAGRVR